MDAQTTAKIIARRPSSIQLQHNKGWIKLTNQHNAVLLVSQPNKSGACTRAHLSGFGYSGTVPGVALPPAAVKPVADNGAVSLEIDLTKAPDVLAKLVAALPSIKREEDPRRKARARRGTGQAPDMRALIAQADAPEEEVEEEVEEADEEEGVEFADEATEEAGQEA